MDKSSFIISGPPLSNLSEELSFGELILQSLKEGGSDIAQICGDEDSSMTYENIRQKSIRLAMALQKLGIKKGDVVGISSENRFEFTVSIIATMAIGAVNATLNAFYSKNELLHTTSISKPILVFCSAVSIQKIRDIMKDVPSIKHIISYGNETLDESVILYKDLFMEDVDISKFQAVKVNVKTDPCAILCSSGTTGLPKCVIQSHFNLLVATRQLSMVFEIGDYSDSCVLLFAPWFHGFGFLTSLIYLAIRIKYVFMIKFDKHAFLNNISKYKISLGMLVPPVMVLLAKDPIVDDYDLSSLKQIWCGAAPLSKETQMAVTKRLGIHRIYQGYGLTEVTSAFIHSCELEIKYGSSGKLVAGMIVKVIDLKTGEPLGPYKEGEIWVKGPLRMLGYMGNDAATSQIIDKDDWVHTGDIGYYDEDEYFFIVDRLKELIKYKAFQVPPAELEALLLQHPAIKDVGVVGLPDEEAGELPMAFVVLQSGITVTEKEIIDFIAKQVSHPKRLHGGVRFIKEIPKNTTGKILRRDLRNILKISAY